jgi:hypothetical protein
MKIEVIVYTETNGHRNSLDTAHKSWKTAQREIAKALKNKKDVLVKVDGEVFSLYKHIEESI